MLELALEMRNRVGCIGVVVDAKPDAVTFYSALGFEAIELVSVVLGDRPEPVAMSYPSARSPQRSERGIECGGDGWNCDRL